MDTRNNGHFWPSYVDIMTTLFAIMLVLFAVSFCRFKKTNGKLEILVNEYKDIIDVYSAVGRIDSTEYFKYNKEYLKHLFTVDVEFQEKEYRMDRLKLDLTDTAAADRKRADVIEAGKIIRDAVEKVEREKSDASDNIKFLVVIEGQASKVRFDDSDWQNNYVLSYLRARFLDKFWKANGIDLEAIPKCELIISGSGERGVPRNIPDEERLHKQYPAPDDYRQHWVEEESKNQRFLIHIVPVVGNIELRMKNFE